MDESSLPVTMRLAQAAVDAQQRERARLSKTLHDSIGGALSAVAIELDLVGMDFAATPELKARLDAVGQTLEKAFDQVRDLTYEVIPNLVGRIGLEAALHRLAARTGAQLQVAAEPAGFSESQASACYQFAETALQEAIRCGAGNLVVKLSGAQLEIRHDQLFASPTDPDRTLAYARMKLAVNAGFNFATGPDPATGCTIIRILIPTKGGGHAL